MNLQDSGHGLNVDMTVAFLEARASGEERVNPGDRGYPGKFIDDLLRYPSGEHFEVHRIQNHGVVGNETVGD